MDSIVFCMGTKSGFDVAESPLSKPRKFHTKYEVSQNLVTGKPLMVSSMSSHVFRMGVGAPLVTNMGGHGAFRSPGKCMVLPYKIHGEPEGSMSCPDAHTKYM